MKTLCYWGLLVSLLWIVLGSCQSASKSTPESYAYSCDTIQLLDDGQQLLEWTLENEHGMQMKVLNYGGIITHLFVPDAQGEVKDVVLGFDQPERYLQPHPYFGAIVGRYGNRIAAGQFELNEKTYTLAKNNGQNHLHGGKKGFDKVFWKGQYKSTDQGPSLELYYLSKDGEEGYPGNLEVWVTYTLTSDQTLAIEYKANTDQLTIVNLTQHTYFNLSNDSTIVNHEAQFWASQYVPVDESLIPLGSMVSVENSPFDFRSSKRMGVDIDRNSDIQIARGGGYDHSFVADKKEANGLEKVALVSAQDTGIKMEVLTTEPGFQFYTGNFLRQVEGKKPYGKRAGFCIETQHFPDSPNQDQFPSVVLSPEATYFSKTVYAFSNL